ncbi:MAG: hypothetical protein BGO40_03025 [Chryseobacterium sp. 39-10]|nr:hypothetical protein [Chryseobacterium sp.]OJV46549.1 MAG: hypothetical protein BGO40_03025 [Chryseobacterium sp. 39-10]
MRAFKLWLLAVFLLTVVNIVNRVLYKYKIKHLTKAERRKKMQEYDRQEAMALDGFANRNYRTFWNSYLIKETGYKFGVEGEMISSALGKNEVDKTLSEKGKGKLSSWFYGVRLVKILDRLDKDHCINSIDLTKGEWVPKKTEL